MDFQRIAQKKPAADQGSGLSEQFYLQDLATTTGHGQAAEPEKCQ